MIARSGPGRGRGYQRLACPALPAARVRVGASLGATPREATDSWGEDMRWIAGELGNARDMDVFIDEALGPATARLPLPGAGRLRLLAEEQLARDYGERVAPMLAA